MEADSQEILSFMSVDHAEEMSLESPRKIQDEQEATSEARLEPDGESETPETMCF